MSLNLTHDILISGGGMVGLSLATAAAQQGLRVAVIEQNEPETNSESEGEFNPRVSALNKTSENFLLNIGAWQRIPEQRVSTCRSMEVWDGLGSGELNFSASDVSEHSLGHIIENDQIVAALTECGRNHREIDLLTSDAIKDWQQDAQSIRVRTQNERELSARLLVACEGKHSQLREQSDIESWKWSYEHTAIVCTVKHEKTHNHCARQVFLETGPLAFLPLADDHQCAIVWSATSDRSEQLLSLDEAEFLRQLNMEFESKLGNLESASERASFPLTALQAKEYRDNRLLILGDSAHAIHPLAGLGVNLGFLDAATLASEWQRAVERNIDIADEQILRRFQRQRQSHNLAVAGLMEGLKRLFGTQNPAAVLLRNTGLKRLNQFMLPKRQLILGAMGLTGTPVPALCKSPDSCRQSR